MSCLILNLIMKNILYPEMLGRSQLMRPINIIDRKKNSMDVRLFRSRSEMLKRDAVARQRVFGARSLRGARIIIKRDIKTWEQEILVLIRVLLKLFLFLNTYLFLASARAVLGKVSTRSRGRNNILSMQLQYIFWEVYSILIYKQKNIYICNNIVRTLLYFIRVHASIAFVATHFMTASYWVLSI